MGHSEATFVVLNFLLDFGHDFWGENGDGVTRGSEIFFMGVGSVWRRKLANGGGFQVLFAYNTSMALHRKVSKIGGSVGVFIPRDIAEAMGVDEGSLVRLSLVGRQLVIEPEDDAADDDTFRRAFSTVLRRHGDDFKALAEFDAGVRKRGTKKVVR
jgi:antitoxin component of MazEF toxin-antitoxin module